MRHTTTPPDRETQAILRYLQQLPAVALSLSAAARGHDTGAPDGQPLLPTGHAAPHRRLPPSSTPPDTAALRASDALRALEQELRDLLRRSRLALGWGKHMLDVSRATGRLCPWCGRRTLLANITDGWIMCTAVDTPARARHAEAGFDQQPTYPLDHPMVPKLFGITPTDRDLDADELPFNVEDTTQHEQAAQ